MSWLRETTKDGDVFYNIGANFGLYVLALNRFFRLRQTVAFEPEALNFAELCSNVYLNGLLDVVSLPIALLDRSGFDDFFISNFTAGNASNKTTNYATSAGVDDPAYFVQGYKQKVISKPLDTLVGVAGIEPPNIILMDIDGGEILALKGMADTLKATTLRALVVEVADETVGAVRDTLTNQGFTLVKERTQRRGNEFFIRG